MKKFIENGFMVKNLSTLRRFKELVTTFWKTKSIAFSSKNSKLYFGDAKLEDWLAFSKPPEFSIKPLITWVGQATFLIQVAGINILTDPIFNDLMFLYKRNAPPGVDINDLPDIDLILISHNHGDHMNMKTLLELKKKHKPNLFVPFGNKSFLKKKGFDSVTEMKWGGNKTITLSRLDGEKKIKLTFLPSMHWSGRGFLDINKTMWGSWMLQVDDLKLYFAGDSSYSDHFKKISEEFSDIDVAFLPIAPASTKEVAKYCHLDSNFALKAFLDLNAKHFIPMHWGTFRLGLDKFDEQITNLQSNWKKTCSLLKDKELHVLKFGQQLEL